VSALQTRLPHLLLLDRIALHSDVDKVHHAQVSSSHPKPKSSSRTCFILAGVPQENRRIPGLAGRDALEELSALGRQRHGAADPAHESNQVKSQDLKTGYVPSFGNLLCDASAISIPVGSSNDLTANLS